MARYIVAARSAARGSPAADWRFMASYAHRQDYPDPTGRQLLRRVRAKNLTVGFLGVMLAAAMAVGFGYLALRELSTFESVPPDPHTEPPR
jgi:hypothetical protein